MIDTLTRIGGDPTQLASLAASHRLPDLLFLPATASTQQVARELAERGAPAWSVVLADHQTAGRGQHGRSWHDRAGSSLLLSLLLRPDPETMPLIPLRAGLAIAAAVDRLLSPGPGRSARTMIKWPNDIVLRDCKVGGVLCEGQIRGEQCAAIVGIGLNVRGVDRELIEEAELPAGSLVGAGMPAERVDLLRALVPELRERLARPEPTLTGRELEEFASRDWLRDRPLREPAAGYARGIDRHGHLLVESDDGTIAASFGSARLAATSG